MAVELGANRAQDHGAHAHRLFDKGIGIVDIEVQLDRRSTKPLGPDGTEVRILVREKNACRAETQFRMTDPAVAGVDQCKVERGTECANIEVDRLLRPFDDQVRAELLRCERHGGRLRRCAGYYVTMRNETMQDPDKLKRKPGRPPSVAARQKVLDTAHRILAEEGLGRLTIDRVALESGVGKPTIYRTWANSHELAMAAFLAAPRDQFGTPQARSTRKALTAHLAAVIATFDSVRGRQITLTMASADPESELAKAFRTQIMLQSREVGRALLARGIAAGQLRQPADLEIVLDMIYGPLFYRLLAGHLPLTSSVAQRLIDTLMSGIDVQDPSCPYPSNQSDSPERHRRGDAGAVGFFWGWW